MRLKSGVRRIFICRRYQPLYFLRYKFLFVINYLHIGKNYVIHVYKENAMKETHPEGSDRNTASPTESAVCESRGREHSGADCLNPAFEVNVRYVTLLS